MAGRRWDGADYFHAAPVRDGVAYDGDGEAEAFRDRHAAALHDSAAPRRVHAWRRTGGSHRRRTTAGTCSPGPGPGCWHTWQATT